MVNSSLEINGLVVRVKLGLTEEERAKPQNVDLDIIMNFDELPEACNSDYIEDTLCYANLAKIVKEFCVNKEFKLIENLSFSIYKLLKPYVKGSLKVKICKKPPIKEIKGNCCFSIY